MGRDRSIWSFPYFDNMTAMLRRAGTPIAVILVLLALLSGNHQHWILWLGIGAAADLMLAFKGSWSAR